MNKITVVGAGYVGLANSFLIGLSHKVTLIDINQQKIESLNNGVSPINDKYINDYINQVNVEYTTDKQLAYAEANIIFVATDTDYDDELNKFNLKSVEGALKDISNYAKEDTIIVIKSTVPIGFTDKMQDLYPHYKLIFSPEFLREGHALYDNLHPDRIVVGGGSNLNADDCQLVADLLAENVIAPEVPVVFTSNSEAEVVKLFANTYLAMRVSFVNELDTYCQSQNMQTANVLDAIGYDKRIGREYWNPSFGYGGYCLPKDTKQLNSEYVEHAIPQTLVSNIVSSNVTRKQFIANKTIELIGKDKSKTIGIYRIIAKKGINNFRSSATVDVALLLKEAGYKIIIFEPYAPNEVEGMETTSDFEYFKANSQLIIANRLEPQIKDLDNVYTVDVYNQY